MQKENNLTAGQWCDHWFTANRHKWNSNTEGGYRNLIYSHIIPSIGGVVLSGLTKQTIINFYDSLRSQGLGARSVWCVHLLLRRCMDEAAQDQLIPYNPVRLCQEPKAEEYKTAPLRLGQLQRYLNAAEQLGVLPLIYTGLVEHVLQLLPLLWMLLHPLVCGSGSFRVHGAYPAPIRLKLFIRLGILEGHELTTLSVFTKSL